MVLGLYYITKIRPGAKGSGLTFYGPEEAIIANNEGRCDLHAPVKVVVTDLVDGKLQPRMVETSVGRVIVNGIIPDEVGYFNDIISKKTLRGIIADVIKSVGMARACEFLDGIKNLGYRMAYVAGLSSTSTTSSFLMRKKRLLSAATKKYARLPRTITWVSSPIPSAITRLSTRGHT